MHFLSLTVRCYRIHRELSVEFAPGLTLIGGPNETGKSTLIEALHRALFLRAKGNTEFHRAMVSHLHGGRPEVTLRFSAAGTTYELRKAFGANGTTVLSAVGAAALTGDAAESELARLVGAEAAQGRRGIEGQWAHLWVWQGTSIGDPTEHATTQQDALRPKLQAAGGDALLTSRTDTRVAQHFADVIRQYFTQRAQPAKNGPLGQAASALANAELDHARAAERLNRLNSAIAEVEESTRQLATAQQDEAKLDEESAELARKLSQLETLRRNEVDHSRTAASAQETLGKLDEANTAIGDLAGKLRQHQEAEQPAAAHEAAMDKAHAGALDACRAAEVAQNSALDAGRKARAVFDLHTARLEQLRATASVAELTARAESIVARRNELEALRTALAALPALDTLRVKKLTRLQTDQLEAEATLRAMATGIDLVASNAPVLVGSDSVAPGGSIVVVADTEVRVGENTVLRIRPGGGTSLDDARRQLSINREKFRAALAEHGLEDLAAAHEIVARRNLLASKIEDLEQALAAKDVVALPKQLEAARADVAAREADAARRAALLPDITLAGDMTGASAAVDVASAAVRQAEDHESAATRLMNLSRKRVDAAAEDLAKAREKRVRLQQEVTATSAQLNLLRATHGQDEERALRLADARNKCESARGTLAATQQAIAALQPELLQRTQTRLGRAREELRRSVAAAAERRALAQGSLVSDGTEDPVATEAAAKAALQRVRAQYEQVAHEAKAVQLVHDEFEAAQRELADRYTRPLAERISGYLECVFGAGARAVLAHSPEGFAGLALVRGFSTVPFEALSGGTREQVAAAARLALAEILAADFGGCLPVCFDDAFAYADPDRVKVLQTMLDLAASRGLQIIILSCNPTDYRSLGAREVLLSRPTLPVAPLSGDSPANRAPAEAALAPDSASAEEPYGDSNPAVAVNPELQEQLLAKLAELEGSAGNQSLREALGWDDATYEVVKRILLAANRIKSGRGRGGSVSLMGLS